MPLSGCLPSSRTAHRRHGRYSETATAQYVATGRANSQTDWLRTSLSPGPRSRCPSCSRAHQHDERERDAERRQVHHRERQDTQEPTRQTSARLGRWSHGERLCALSQAPGAHLPAAPPPPRGGLAATGVRTTWRRCGAGGPIAGELGWPLFRAAACECRRCTTPTRRWHGPWPRRDDTVRRRTGDRGAAGAGRSGAAPAVAARSGLRQSCRVGRW